MLRAAFGTSVWIGRSSVMAVVLCAAYGCQDALSPVGPESAAAQESKTTTDDVWDPADWPMYNYDVRGWRHNPAETRLSVKSVPQLKLKWRFPPEGAEEIAGAFNATPVVVNGYVYIGTSTHPRFYKFRPDGTVAWVFDVTKGRLTTEPRVETNRGLVPNEGVYSSALVTRDSVYFGDTKGVAFCLDRKTGELRWKIDSRASGFPGVHRANVLMASPILADGRVVFAGGAYEHAIATRRGYECCHGRGFVMAVSPDSGRIAWKYDVGPEPEKFDPPVTMKTPFGTRVFHYGPSTSSVWSTPSFDPETHSVYFGTDVHNAPRRPTDDDPRNYTEHSAAVIALDSRTGMEKWVTQTNTHDIWNHGFPSYDPKTGYKDQSIGDTPKLLTIDVDGDPVRVVGVGSKNGGFYLMRRDNGRIVTHTPLYKGPPSDKPKVDPRTLALPSPIGGLQTGCATDGRAIFTNGVDNIYKVTATLKAFSPPTGGRVTSITVDTSRELWRHERPKVAWVGGTKSQPKFRNVGDPVASGIAVANGCLFFTTFSSNKLVALNASNGEVLKEIDLGPVLAGPSVSRGRVFVGTGNTLFVRNDSEAYFPKSQTGVLFAFGIPGEDEFDRMGKGSEE